MPPGEQGPELNAAYRIPEFLPGWIGIASNGGAELLALDRTGQVLMVPFVPMHADDAVCIAEDIPALARTSSADGMMLSNQRLHQTALQ